MMSENPIGSHQAGPPQHGPHNESPQDRNKRVHRAVQNLRMHEAAIASNSKAARKARVKKHETFGQYLLVEQGRYWGFVFKMWGLAIRSVLFGGSLHPAQLWPAFYFASLTTGALTVLFCFCVSARIPMEWAAVFRFVLHLATRTAQAISLFFSPLTNAIRFIWESNFVLIIRHSPIVTFFSHSVLARWISKIYEDYYLPTKILRRMWYNLRDAEVPASMFDQLREEQVEVAKESLSQSIYDAPSKYGSTRVFDLDLSKFLLQLAALMYENHGMDGSHAMELVKYRRQQQRRRSTMKANGHIADLDGDGDDDMLDVPEELLHKELGTQDAEEVRHWLYETHPDDKIANFCLKWGLEYEPVSELNTSSASFCSVFWDKNSNWIVLAFKGTGPTDFSEWVTDFNYHLIPGGSWLKGFGKVHSGFADRIFPRTVRDQNGRRPYDTISAAVKIISNELRKNGKGDVNVWMTGHSLGTAIASLAYARAVSAKNDFGKKCVVRDAYLFATPIITDVTSVHAFNYAMFRNVEKVRTMWRITNRNDFVAAGLPESGDRPDCVYPENPFCFAHLGTEIKIKDKQGASVEVTGNHITEGIPVVIRSRFSDEELLAQRTDGLMEARGGKRLSPLQEITDWKLYIPFVGSLLAHDVKLYWDSLTKVTNTTCEWVDN